jgi:phytoene desaturase
MPRKQVVIIGSGFSSLAAAGIMAQKGHDVTLLEKNNQAGGRARIWQQDGFTFDMGPSWYWMPEVFEHYYNIFGKTTADFYDLKRLDPAYRVYYKDDTLDIPASLDALYAEFEKREVGSAAQLRKFLDRAKYKYDTAMGDYIYKMYDKTSEIIHYKHITKAIKLQILKSVRSEVRSAFKHPSLVRVLEFPVLFLGSTPQHTPSMYSLMNYADLVLGTWYPMGGMHQIVQAMVSIAEQQGVKIILNQEVTHIAVTQGRAKEVHTGTNVYPADAVIAGSDYHHTEQQLLDPEYRRYDEAYWQRRTMSPSSLLYYIGVSKKLKGLLHHNLFFDTDFEQHAADIYDTPRWPRDPLFYASVPSITDPTVAPAGMDNLFLLIPIAPGITDSESERERYLHIMLDRLEQRMGESFREHIVLQRSYCLSDFERDYHSYKGNAYGLANILSQTALWKPKMKSPKVKNLLYTGQLTVPGPGVPPAIISGQIAASELERMIENKEI